MRRNSRRRKLNAEPPQTGATPKEVYSCCFIKCLLKVMNALEIYEITVSSF